MKTITVNTRSFGRHVVYLSNGIGKDEASATVKKILHFIKKRRSPKQKQDLILQIVCYTLLGVVMTVNVFLYAINF